MRAAEGIERAAGGVIPCEGPRLRGRALIGPYGKYP
jgi:hypothetical protein